MMNGRLIFALGAAALLAIGLTVLSFGDGGNGPQAAGAGEVVQGANNRDPDIPEPTEEQKDFQSMTVEADEDNCAAPFVPADLHDDLLTRSSYAAIMRILAAKRWEETGSCRCLYDEISWDEVVKAAPEYEEADGSIAGLNPSNLGRLANRIENRRTLECGT